MIRQINQALDSGAVALDNFFMAVGFLPAVFIIVGIMWAVYLSTLNLFLRRADGTEH